MQKGFDFLDGRDLQTAPVHHTAETSIAALEALHPHDEGQRGRVFREICRSPGKNRAELAALLGMKLQSVCGRCAELLGGNEKKRYPVRVYESGVRDGGKLLYPIKERPVR
jgi:hypothetical protein